MILPGLAGGMDSSFHTLSKAALRIRGLVTTFMGNKFDSALVRHDRLVFF